MTGAPALFARNLEQTAEWCRAAGYSGSWAAKMRRAVLAGREPELPPGLATIAREGLPWLSSRVLTAAPAEDGALKLLLAMQDGETLEAVRLPGAQRGSACLSTQIGCAMACRFCASGLNGVRRNLSAQELVEQIAWLRRHGPVTRLVLMGSGEPSQNLRAVVDALSVLKAEGEIGPRHVLISTVGPVSAITRITATGLRITLALSLHALDRGLRGALIPTQAEVDPLELLAAADAHDAATGRAYQVEYVMLGGVNDSAAQARDLAAALHGRRAHLSLIPWNTVAEQPFRAPSAKNSETFLRILREAGVSAVLRRTVGGTANAACGQLRNAHLRIPCV